MTNQKKTRIHEEQVDLFEGGNQVQESSENLKVSGISENTLNYQVETYRCSYFAALFLVGIFNNNGYVLVQAGSSNLAEMFHQQDFMSAFQFAMTSFSILTRLANGTILINVPHMTRITYVCILSITSFSLIALASFNAPAKDAVDPGIFWFCVAVLASCLIGIASGMGEATFLGFLKGYPSHTVGYVSSGTGFAGISGTLTLLILQGINLPNQYIFIIALPTILVYFTAFQWLNRKKKKFPFIEPKVARRQSMVDQHNQHLNPSAEHSTAGGDAQALLPPPVEEEQEVANISLTCASGSQILPKSFSLSINLCTVYFLEYSIISCFADRMKYKIQNRYPQELHDNVLWVNEYYVILQYCYQMGVFFSRSSLSLIKIPKHLIWILTFLQTINFVYFFLNTQYMFAETLFINGPIMVWVGFMGGAAYVNVMHNLLDLPSLKKEEREVALVCSLILNDIGVLSSSIFTQVIDLTVFPSNKL